MLMPQICVGMCSMTEDSAGELAALLKKGHLQELNIYSNDVGDGGMFKVRDACLCSII